MGMIDGMPRNLFHGLAGAVESGKQSVTLFNKVQ